MLRVILIHMARSARMPSRIGLLGLALLAAGCAGTADIDRMNQFQAPYSQGDWWGAAATLGAGEEGISEDEDNLLTLLQAGSALRAAGSFETSQTALDRAESKLLWKADEIDDVGEFLEAGLSIVGNDLISSYHGNIYDGVLINTYKAMNALDQGDEDRARVELNRADQRQENAVHQLAAKVKALGEEDEQEAADRQANASDVNQTYRDATKPGSEISKRIAAVRGLGKYRDLRNPFTDWLHGAFRLATGEPNRASDLLRNAVVLDGERNRYVKDDFRVAEEAAAGVSGGIPRRVWIVHEDGIGPRLDEFRYDLPVFAPSGFIYSGIALPEFVTGDSRRRLALRRGRRRVVPHRAAAQRRPLRGDRVRGRLRRHRRQGDRLRRGEGGRADRRATGGRADGRPHLRPALAGRHHRLRRGDDAGRHAHVAGAAEVDQRGEPALAGGRQGRDLGRHRPADRGCRAAGRALRAHHREDGERRRAGRRPCRGAQRRRRGDDGLGRHGGEARGGARSGVGRAPGSSGGDDLGPGSRARSRSQ